MNWKKYMILCCMVFYFFGMSQKVSAKKVVWDKDTMAEKVMGNYAYTAYLSKDGKYAWIYQVKVRLGKEASETLKFPEKIQGADVVKLGGVCKPKDDLYQTIFGIGVEPFHEIDGYENMPKGIVKLKIPDTVEEITPAAFCGFRDLEEVVLSENLKELKSWVFYHCKNLRLVKLPEKLETIASGAFEKCKALQEFQLSFKSEKYSVKEGFLLSKDGKTFYQTPAGKKIVSIPEGVENIAAGAFVYAETTKVRIPETVTSIEGGAFVGSKVTDLVLLGNHQVYEKKKNCIYHKKSGSLIAVICENGTVTLPKQVKKLASGVSYLGEEVDKMIIPKTVSELEAGCFQRMNENGYVHIVFKAKKPPKASAESFDLSAAYHVPKGSLESYQKWFRHLLGEEEAEDITLMEGWSEETWDFSRKEKLMPYDGTNYADEGILKTQMDGDGNVVAFAKNGKTKKAERLSWTEKKQTAKEFDAQGIVMDETVTWISYDDGGDRGYLVCKKETNGYLCYLLNKKGEKIKEISLQKLIEKAMADKKMNPVQKGSFLLTSLDQTGKHELVAGFSEWTSKGFDMSYSYAVKINGKKNTLISVEKLDYSLVYADKNYYYGVISGKEYAKDAFSENQSVLVIEDRKSKKQVTKVKIPDDYSIVPTKHCMDLYDGVLYLANRTGVYKIKAGDDDWTWDLQRNKSSYLSTFYTITDLTVEDENTYYLMVFKGEEGTTADWLVRYSKKA